MSFFSDVHMWLVSDRKPFSVIEQALPLTQQIGQTNWRLSDHFWQDTAQNISLELDNGWCQPLPYTLLKSSSTRRVFVLSSPQRCCVVKSFNFRQSLGRKTFRHRLFGRDEAISLILAAQRGLPVPRLYAYGETRRGFMCLESIQLIEYIKEGLTYPEFILQTGQTAKQALRRLATLVLKLYHGGCLHPDPHYEQFLLSPHGAEHDRIIDFQYAQFNRSSLNQLVYQLAHLLRSLQAHHYELENSLISCILQELFIKLELPTATQNKWTETFFDYLHAKEDLSRQKIMKLQ